MSVDLLVPGKEQQYQQLRHSVSIPERKATSNTNTALNVPANNNNNNKTSNTLGLPTPPRSFMRAKSVPHDEGSGNSPAKSRRVRLGPGCGLLDWIRLTRTTKDIAGTGGKLLTVSEEELAEHCTEKDAWTCVRGKTGEIEKP